jgi:D-alanyl-D-alanine dipeptidase
MLKKTTKIKILDNGEKLVDIKKYCSGVKINLDDRRMKVEKTAYVREGVAKMLAKAQKFLPRGWNFVIRDAWRSRYVQVYTYYFFIKMFKREHPTWTEKRVIEEVEKYVADWEGTRASGHMTGGAIDLRLVDKRGRRVPMRAKNLTYQENAQPLCDKLPAYLKRNREILFDAMKRAGFTACHNEFWHWSYGDHQWARIEKKRGAIYAVIDKDFYDQEPCPCGSGKKFAECHK